jgi:hypothetical protein
MQWVREVISNGLLGPDRTKRNDFVKYEGITKAGERKKKALFTAPGRGYAVLMTNSIRKILFQADP